MVRILDDYGGIPGFFQSQQVCILCTGMYIILYKVNSNSNHCLSSELL